MGEIHLAYSGQAELKKLCVIKNILGHLADSDFINRFVDEAKVVVKLSHGNLVPVFEAGEIKGQYFVAMEYIEGKDLRDIWNRLFESGHLFPLDVALYVIREVARGLSYVHTFEDLHLVHRDVSPPNVLISYTGEVRLADFGVATSTIKLQKTAPGILLGKLSYMSPEQARNDPVDARADIYSLGVILWEFLTGKRLFPSNCSQIERYQRAVNPIIQPPSKINPQVPPSLDLIALRALAPQRENRYAEAEQLRKDLATALAKIAPTTDATAAQQLLKELYGPEIQREREERRQFLDAVAPKVKTLIVGNEKRTRRPYQFEQATTELVSAPVEGPSPPDRSGSGPLPRLPAGTILDGRYAVKDLIGEGGMGTVYVATHIDIEKQVALKVLHPSYSRMPEVVARFRQEARAASRIGHPHIVEVFDSGVTTEGSIYFVMEHLSGMDLAEVLDNEGRLSVERSLRIAIQICEALAAAHEAGIIHRDLKPENIFLTMREGEPDFVKVLDFGIAKNIELEEIGKEQLTYPGIAMGTPEYMAPEQAAGQPSDHRVDIYAAGALFYEMLIGQPPHTGGSYLAILNSKTNTPITPPRSIRTDISPEFERIILWALEYRPEDRPQSMAQLSYELNKLTRGRAGAVASLLGIPQISATKTATGLVPILSTTELPNYNPIVPTQMVSKGVWHKPWMMVLGGTLLAGSALGIGFYFHLTKESMAPRLVSAGSALSDNTASTSRLTGIAKDPQASSVALVSNHNDISLLNSKIDSGINHLTIPHKKAGATRPATPSYLQIARDHLNHSRFNQAREAFAKASHMPKLHAKALIGLAEVEFQLSQYRTAAKYAKEAVAQGGGLAAKLVLGNSYFRLGDYKNAVAMYKKVLEIDKNHKEARNNMAAAQKRLGH